MIKQWLVLDIRYSDTSILRYRRLRSAFGEHCHEAVSFLEFSSFHSVWEHWQVRSPTCQLSLRWVLTQEVSEVLNWYKECKLLGAVPDLDICLWHWGLYSGHITVQTTPYFCFSTIPAIPLGNFCMHSICFCGKPACNSISVMYVTD